VASGRSWARASWKEAAGSVLAGQGFPAGVFLDVQKDAWKQLRRIAGMTQKVVFLEEEGTLEEFLSMQLNLYVLLQDHKAGMLENVQNTFGVFVYVCVYGGPSPGGANKVTGFIRQVQKPIAPKLSA
jgi:hypothetical protein